MVITWEEREGTQASKPSVVDFESSKVYVYLRKDIERDSRTEEDGNVVFFWRYTEAKLTHEEYEQYIKETDDVTTAMMMQYFNDLQATQELSDITVEMNHEEEMQLLNDIQADIALLGETEE